MGETSVFIESTRGGDVELIAASAIFRNRYTYMSRMIHTRVRALVLMKSGGARYEQLTVPAPPDHFWLCPIPFVLEYPNQPDHFSL